MSEARGLLLDTQAWFWLVTGDARLSDEVVAQLEAASGAGRLFLSQISAWEIALKVSTGKLRLNMPIGRWLQENTAGLTLLDLPLDVVIDATQLPGTFHRDPADRFIVAAARHHGLTLATADEVILAYARQGHVEALAL